MENYRRKKPREMVMKHSTSSQLMKYGLAVLIVFFLGAAAEYFFHIPLLKSHQRGRTEISLDQVSLQGFERTEEGLLLTGDQGRITVGLDGAYVEQFIYRFQYEHLLNAKLYVCYYNEYGEADPEQDRILLDRNHKLVPYSSVRIGEQADSIVLAIDRQELGEAGSREEAARLPLVITGLELSNELVINGYRLAFFWVLFGLMAYFWLFRGYLGKHPEAGFLVVCLGVGLLLIGAMPANKTGYDEETHLYRAMGIASYPKGMNINQTIFSLMIPSLDSWPENQPGSRAEQQALLEYLNKNGDYKQGNIHLEPVIPKGAIPAYLGQALVLKVCKAFHVPWGLMLMAGRIGNLLVYSMLMYFAIRRTPAGKLVMAVIGLMPTSLFLACTYSYDPWVTSWIYLGSACFLRELLTPDQKITWKSWGFLLLCFFLGCSPKAVYAPMVLILLLLPAKKFADKRQKYLMRTGIFLLLAALLASFILPVLIAPKDTGDIRGGATSEVGQMSYILGHFFGYLKILFANIFRTLPKMVFGRDVFSLQGHLAESPFTWLAAGLAGFTVVTDTKLTSPQSLSMWQRVWIFFMLGGSVLLVWTSMYIAYTEPGRVEIAGVQGRYYLPVLYLLYLLFQTRSIVARFKNMWYHTGVLGVSAGLLLATVWVTVMVPLCL